MAQNQQEKLVVSLRDATSWDPSGQHLRDVSKLINSLQSQVEVVTDVERAHNLNVILDQEDESTPYYRPLWITESDPGAKTSIAIDLAFYKRQNITVPLPDYISYFISIIILEYLSREWDGQELRIFKEHEYYLTNELVWRGSVTPSAISAVERLSRQPQSPNRKALLDAVGKLREAAVETSHRLSNLTREVSDFLEGLKLTNVPEPYKIVRSFFHTIGPHSAARLTRQFRSEDKLAVHRLVDQIESRPTPEATVLLKGLATARNLASEVKGYAQQAVERIQSGEPNLPPLPPEPEEARTGQFGASNDSTEGPDLLGYNEYAQAIADVVSDDQTSTPLTMAIGGPWGRGKTKLLDLISKAVDSRNGEKGRTKCHSISINAWELAKTEHIWAEFYGRLLDQVEDKLSFLRRLGLRILFAYVRSRLATVSVILTAVAVGAVAYFAPVLWAAVSDIEVPDWAPKASTWGAIILPILGLSLKFGRRLSQHIFKGLKSLSVRKVPGTEQEVLKNTHTITKLLPNLTNDRFLISVDDIDRCSPEKTLELLEAIKLFLNTKGFVFFLAMDCRVVMRAVGEHYKFMSDGNAGPQEMGRQYLEKIIQVPFHLPPIGGERLKDLNKALLGTYMARPSQPVSTEEAQPPSPDSDKPPQPQSFSKPAYTPTRRDPITEDSLARLDDIEYRAIVGFLDKVDQDMSPRLFKRFVNIYMIARNMYIARQDRLEADSVVPPKGFAHWLALSVVYPFEAKELIRWLERNKWADPLDHLTRVLDIDDLSQQVDGMWKNHNPVHVQRFAHLYSVLEIDRHIVKRTKHITDCFNLVLD